MESEQIWTPDQRLLALSWKEPFASLMLHGKVETRTWNTNYRGWVLICVSKQSYPIMSVWNISGNQLERIRKLVPPTLTNHYPTEGKAIAIGRLTCCRQMKPGDEKICFVEWSPGRHCHFYEDVRAIEPFPWKGSQGWREVSEELKAKIKFL